MMGSSTRDPYSTFRIGRTIKVANTHFQVVGVIDAAGAAMEVPLISS